MFDPAQPRSEIRLQLSRRVKELALFNLAIDSKLRGCDIVRLRVQVVKHGEAIVSRTSVMQQNTGQPVKFELTDPIRDAVGAWIAEAELSQGQYLFPSQLGKSAHISTRQYARMVKSWVALIGLDPREYGTHSMRRTKATLIYRRTKNLRAILAAAGTCQAGEHCQVSRD